MYRNQGLSSQSTSASESDTSWDEWSDSQSTTDSESEYERVKASKTRSDNSPALTRRGQARDTPLTDWKKIQIACADWALPATLAFPVRVTDGGQRAYTPVNPKDVEVIVKAIADKGISSAMVSTLVDSVFGNEDMLPFGIKQTCRMIFDGAGMIVFKQEWEDSCTKQLAQVTGADHPLRGFSLQQLMGTDPATITPQAQAQHLRAPEVAVTT